MIEIEIKEQLKKELINGAIEVIFKKANNEERVMLCTLNIDLIPPADQPKDDTEASPEAPKRAQNENVQVVYDLDKDAWRSFRWDRLVAFHN